MHLLPLLGEAVATHPDALFLTDLRTANRWTFGDVRHGADHIAALLRKQGVRAGDRVAFLTRNDPVFFPLLIACAATGSTLVPINRESVRGDIDAIIEDAKPSLILYDEAHPAQAGPSMPVTWQTNASECADVADLRPSDDALIIYTSGTTGDAKGVRLSHANLCAMARSFVDFYRLRAGLRLLSMLPFYHINAPMITGLVAIAARAHVFLTDPYGAANARRIFEFVETERINVISLTPSIMASLLQLHPDGPGRDLSSLEFCFCGTAALGERLWRDFEALCRAPVYQGYGLTETTTWATMTPPDARKRYDSAGLPVGCELRIDGAPTGEVLIKGDIVMNGYHQKKALTQRSIQGGWYRSGDIGFVDDDGQLVIVGRCKNVIKRRGVLIHPESIDARLRQAGLVADCCTVGVPDSLAGERVVTACVQPKLPVDELRMHIAKHFSAEMRLDDLVVIGAIPRNSIGKALVGEVRDWVSGGAADRVMKVLSSCRVARAHGAHDETVRATVQRALLAGLPIRFVGYWGVGSRAALAEPDRLAMTRLAWVRKTIDEAIGRPLVSIELLLADVHARCNLFSAEHIERYLVQIEALAASEGIVTSRLSARWQEAGLDEGVIDALIGRADLLDIWQAFALREVLLTQAQKHCCVPAQSESAAVRYFCICCIERRALGRVLPETIFFTYNAPALSGVLPALPTVYWHSTKPGTAAKPWFM